MAETSQHLLLAVLDGHAELEIPERHLVTGKLPIRFHQKTLRFELFLPSSDEVVGVLGPERRSLKLLLRNVVLRDSTKTIQLTAEGVPLYRSNALSEWPESMEMIWSDCDEGAGDTRRLELAPWEQALTFQADQAISVKHPFQIYYWNGCPGLREPRALEYRSFPETVSFKSDFPQRGVLCAFSAGDFFAHEERIHAGWMLIHGRELPSALQIKGREVCFFGMQEKTRPSYLPLVDDWGSALPDCVMNRLVEMVQARFSAAYLALKYFLAGKQADVWLEARYMLLMTCVEAMDGGRQLKEETTAAMLGVSADAAFLLNCMRNQLVHGRGGFQQAFDAFVNENLKGRQLASDLADCLVNGRKLDFAHLWLRVCERLDAFWCAYLGIPDELTKQRYSPMPLMAAVNKSSIPKVP